MIQTSVKYALEARLAGGDDSDWIIMPGFMYDTREELQVTFNEHFRAIQGQGCDYRFAKLTETITHEVVDQQP